METSKFRVGDVVKLKSGGLMMTVVASGTSDYVGCTWFKSDGGGTSGNFPEEALDIVDPTKLQVWTTSAPAFLYDWIGQRHSHDNGTTWKSGAYCYCYSYLYW